MRQHGRNEHQSRHKLRMLAGDNRCDSATHGVAHELGSAIPLEQRRHEPCVREHAGLLATRARSAEAGEIDRGDVRPEPLGKAPTGKLPMDGRAAEPMQQQQPAALLTTDGRLTISAAPADGMHLQAFDGQHSAPRRRTRDLGQDVATTGRSRSCRRSTFPVPDFGISSRISISRGYLYADMRFFANVMSSRSSTCSPAVRTTNALTVSPRYSSGTPITAASATAG